jgi:anti-sigma factor RsiW
MSQSLSEGGPMACPEGHDLELHVDGELAEADREQIEAHLDRCDGCRRQVAEKLAFKRRLHRTTEARSARAPDALRARLRLKLDAEPVPEAATVAPAARRPFRWARPMPLAAGATAVGLAAWVFLGRTTNDLARDLVARHARPQPLELQSDDPGVVEGWFSGKSDFPVHVPRPESARFALMGARFSHVRDRPAVYLQYGDRQSPMHRVSVIVFDDPTGHVPLGAPRRVLNREFFTGRASGYNVMLWRRNELVYSVVSDADDEGLEFVEATERSSPRSRCRSFETAHTVPSFWDLLRDSVKLGPPVSGTGNCID